MRQTVNGWPARASERDGMVWWIVGLVLDSAVSFVLGLLIGTALASIVLTHNRR